MKTITIVCLILIINSPALSFSKAYEKAMVANIKAFYAAKDEQALQTVADKFEEIGESEKKEWLPWYYIAFIYTNMAAITQNTSLKDGFLDRAQSFLDKATKLKDQESENVALQGYIYMIRVTVDPTSRGQELAPKAIQTLSKATEINPENPRAWLLLGQMQYGTAKFMGTDTSEPCTAVKKSLNLFEKPVEKETLMPSWGKDSAEALNEQCSGQ